MTKTISLIFTENAKAHLKQKFLEKPQALGFRLSMRKYGCNGFGYVPEIIDSINPQDIEIDITSEFRTFIDAKFSKALDGTVIDYVKKGLAGSHLVFSNPNAQGECGCGESVNLKSDDAHD